ncbi:DNA-3-methyladenine glycosylase I [Rothia sp. P5764]|uniref:DNA-3-methyladenine glycosylase I n=1 Tax=unclassified Rothia (in: high G+C Gram-positive bacteria) TaxID=2689056 RepID=UPI003ACD74BA
MLDRQRCPWALQSEIERDYHDRVWGRPQHNDRALLAMLNLEGQQAGLSWYTVLSKIESLYRAYADFDPEVLVTYGDQQVASLMQTEGIIRNQLKIRSVLANAHAYVEVCHEFGSFDNYLWSFVNYQPIINFWKSSEQVPARTDLSESMSKDLKARGFKFVGPTTVYAFMQATGMVNDHLLTCPIREQTLGTRKAPASLLRNWG